MYKKEHFFDIELKSRNGSGVHTVYICYRMLRDFTFDFNPTTLFFSEHGSVCI